MNKPTILLCTAALALFASCKNHPPCGEGNPVDFIPRDSANKMISSYLNSINSPSNDSDLHAICIDMNQLRLYDQASAGANRISHLKIFFAHKLEYINSGHGGQNAGYNSDALTLVLAGYTVNGNYVYLNGNQVLDHSSPCPHNCPPGQASGDLLQ